FSTPVLCAPSGALFFWAPPGRVASAVASCGSRSVAAECGSRDTLGRNFRQAAARRGSFIELGTGGRGPSRRGGPGGRTPQVARPPPRRERGRPAPGRNPPRGAQPAQGRPQERHKEREAPPAPHPRVTH